MWGGGEGEGEVGKAWNDGKEEADLEWTSRECRGVDWLDWLLWGFDDATHTLSHTCGGLF